MNAFRFKLLRASLLLNIGVALWLASGESASAAEGLPLLLAQGGAVKTMLGYALMLLGIALGLIVVCRPSKRALPEGEDKKRR